MEKYINKFKEIIKKNRLWCLLFVALCVVALFVYYVFFKINIDTITRVKKVLSPKYYSIECLNNDCKYILAYKGNKDKEYTTQIYTSKGKKIADFTDKKDSNKTYTKNVVAASKKYVILEKRDYVTNKVEGYSLIAPNGKARYNSKYELKQINENLISERTGSSTYKIIDYKGKTLYKDVKTIDTFANKTVVSISTKNEYHILNSKGKTTLSGYRVASEVTNNKGEALYFVLQDYYKNAYYYYNYKKDVLDEDSFNGYINESNSGELIIIKSKNGSYKKYILNKDGEKSEIDNDSIKKYASNIRNKVDSKKYNIYADSIIKDGQKNILVNSISDNTVGIYNISSKKYKKIFKLSDSKNVSVSDIESDDKNIYLRIGYKGSDKYSEYVYNITSNIEVFKKENTDIINNYNIYSSGYVVAESIVNEDGFTKNKYVLYDKNNKEVIKNDNPIVVVDKKAITYNKEYVSNIMLYSVKNKKYVIDKPVSIIRTDSSDAYKYSDGKYTYIYSNNGKQIAKFKTEDYSIIYSADTVIYLNDKDINIINLVDNKKGTQKLNKNEVINDNSGETIFPYKNSMFINNTKNKNFKVINSNGNVVKKVNGSTINSVRHDATIGRIIIITKKAKGNSNLYGLYISK